MKKICLAGVASLSLLGIPAFADEPDPLADIYACTEIADDSARLACFDRAVGQTQAAQQSGQFRTLTRQDTERVQEDAFGFSLPSLPSLPSLSFPSFGGNDGALEDAVERAEAPRTETPAPVQQAQTNAPSAPDDPDAPATPAPVEQAEAAPDPARPTAVERDNDGDIQSVTLRIQRINRGNYGRLTIYFRNGQVWRQVDDENVRLRNSDPPTEAEIRRATLGSYFMQFNTNSRPFRVRREE